MYGNNYYTPQRYQGIGVPMVGSQTNQYVQPMPPTSMSAPSMPYVQQATPLLGKVVDSLDVVKATDIPLDGSTSYFPLTDGSAIITKKLQMDGTSKTIIYKPIEEEKPKSEPSIAFASLEDFLNLRNDFDDLKDAFNKLKSENRELRENNKKKESK